MAPAPIAVTQNSDGVAFESSKATNGHSKSKVRLPLEANGSLDNYNFKDLTPCIGREFPTADLVDIMNAPNSEDLLQELALTSTLLC